MRLEDMPPETIYFVCDLAEKWRMSPKRAFRVWIRYMRVELALKDYFDGLPN